MPAKIEVICLEDIKAHCTIEGECWIWDHSTRGPGYAQITGSIIGRGQMNGHVLAWILANNREPKEVWL